MAKDKYFRKMTEKVEDAETKEMEKFDKESDKLDVSFAEKSSGKMAKRVITNYVGDYIGYDGLKPGILNSKQSKVVSELTNYLKQEPDFVGKDSKWIIETKGYLPSHHDFPMRWKLFLKHILENNL